MLRFSQVPVASNLIRDAKYFVLFFPYVSFVILKAESTQANENLNLAKGSGRENNTKKKAMASLLVNSMLFQIYLSHGLSLPLKFERWHDSGKIP